jgi:hypothetical protein
MKKLIPILALGACLTGCVSTQKYGAFVDQKTKTEQPQTVQQDWLIVNTPVSEKQGNNFTQIKSSFIPAIVYWGWNSTISCEIDPNTATEYVRRGIYQAAEHMDLQSRLNGRQLVIDIKQLPGQFVYENKGSTVFLVVAHATTYVEAISPMPTNLVVDYKLLENGAVIASGEHFVRNQEEPLRNVWKSTKKFTWLYLDQFEREANRMGTESIIDIVKQLEG